MKSPNSLLVRLRMWLSDIFKVYPPKGEAWCVRCCQNSGKTLVVSVGGMNLHLRTHEPEDYVIILTEDGRNIK